MKLPQVFFTSLCALASIETLAAGTLEPVGASAAQTPGKLVYADFETAQEKRPVSNRGGVVQLFAYQETATRPSRFKGLEASSPPAPELVRLKQDDPNRAIAFDYELRAPNQYAGVGVEVRGQAEKDGKPVADDVSGYKYLTLQIYATGVSALRLEFISKGNGIEIGSGHPQTVFGIKPGFNTYKIALNSLSQPSWAEVKVNPKEALKKLTAVNLAAFCDQCVLTKGTVVVDNLIFEN